MDYGHYTTRTVQEVVLLANMLANAGKPTDEPTEEPPDETALRALLHRFEIGDEPLDADGLAHLAGRLRQVFTAEDLDVKVRILNDLLALYQPQPQIVDHDGQGHHMHYVPPSAGHLRCIGASMTMAMALVLSDYGADRLGVCPACDDVFIDTTRNGRQRFCSRTCANRINVARHRARSSGATDEG